MCYAAPTRTDAGGRHLTDYGRVVLASANAAATASVGYSWPLAGSPSETTFSLASSGGKNFVRGVYIGAEQQHRIEQRQLWAGMQAVRVESW